MYMILFVLHDTNSLEAVLNGWESAGVTGITILPSTGLGRIRTNAALREDLPLIPRLEDILCHDEQLNRTLFTIVKDDATVAKVKDATERILGDLCNPNTGIMAVLPVAQVYGLQPKQT
ncbi:MAG: hypothetical protein HPY76_08435 [Anaerolineae bacterium]|nr:hypothetical protein [Anaerolineae bacterium]